MGLHREGYMPIRSGLTIHEVEVDKVLIYKVTISSAADEPPMEAYARIRGHHFGEGEPPLYRVGLIDPEHGWVSDADFPNPLPIEILAGIDRVMEGRPIPRALR